MYGRFARELNRHFLYNVLRQSRCIKRELFENRFLDETHLLHRYARLEVLRYKLIGDNFRSFVIGAC